MAAVPKQPQKARLDFSVDKDTYDYFIKACSGKGYAPQIVIERMMKRFNETGQM